MTSGGLTISTSAQSASAFAEAPADKTVDKTGVRSPLMLGGVFLESFPLAHEVSDLPHQRLMLINDAF